MAWASAQSSCHIQQLLSIRDRRVVTEARRASLGMLASPGLASSGNAQRAVGGATPAAGLEAATAIDDTIESVPWSQPHPLFADRLRGQLILAPLTKYGNLPFRRLCANFGANVTMGEMIFARSLLKGDRTEQTRLRHGESEHCFGVQMATNVIDEGIKVAQRAAEAGATWIDLNAGCPIHEATRRGLGARLLDRPNKLQRLVEGIANGTDLPLTVKIRIGPSESKINAAAVVAAVQAAGAAAVVIHGRTQQQRYTKAADWALISQVALDAQLPVIGNGDILTAFEAERRLRQDGCWAAMVGRGALIKPWIFEEWKTKQELFPTAEERVAIYRQLVSYMRSYFGDDEKGKKKAWYFLPGHLGWFCRYRPLPRDLYQAASEEHPLIATRQDVVDGVRGEQLDSLPLLERLLRCSHESAHPLMAHILWDSPSDEGAIATLENLAAEKLQGWEEELQKPRDDRDRVDARQKHDDAAQG